LHDDGQCKPKQVEKLLTLNPYVLIIKKSGNKVALKKELNVRMNNPVQ
jgi:hypothetical protein